MNHVQTVVVNMKKWNCNIVKDMYDRVNRRKFGLLCVDDTSNEDFIKSYINRLDCTPIILSCLKGADQPCTSDEASSTIFCNINVLVGIVLNQSNNYVFTANVFNGTAPYTYSWTYNVLYWQLISNVGNVLVLKPLVNSGSITTPVSVTVTDSIGCTKTWENNILYRGGCTDPDAVNYDPLATFDNGTCYYEPLLVSSAYECEEDDTGTICIQVTGGNPPYTVVGVPNGTILLDGGSLCQNLPNGTNYSFYVVDSLGVVTTVQKGKIECPFDCETVTILPNFDVDCLTDDLGNNTGEAILTLTPSGGNAPYIITGTINSIPGFVNGQIVNNGDIIDVSIVDVNGCGILNSITIECPPPTPGGGEGITCEDLQELNIQASMLVVDSSSVAGIFTNYNYILSYQFTNLASFGLTLANVASIQYTVTPELGYVTHYLSSTPGSPCTVCTGSLIPVVNPGTVPQYVNVNPYDLANTQFVARYAGGCVGTKTLKSTLKLQVTIVTEEVSCVLCFERLLDADWICETKVSTSTSKLLNYVPC